MRELLRYADVMAALREPKLWPAGDEPVAPEGAAHARMRQLVRDAMSPEWTTRIAPPVLPTWSPCDLIGQLAKPWCVQLGAAVTNVRPDHLDRLLSLAAESSMAAATETQATAANAELNAAFAGFDVPMPLSAFVGLSQTLPFLLGNMWLALLQHPAELARLQSDPSLMPSAIEEMMRVGGLTRRLVRQATDDLEIAGLRLPRGERVVLRVDLANRDAEQFPDPDRLDIGRRASGQLTLGAAGHVCVGGPLLRAAASLLTTSWVTAWKRARLCGEVEWCGGEGFRWPARLEVEWE